ncbi:uncharacterized protein [Euwallacea fornicatus]|uniref:uncharacterized protein n=1 Tax=Euwallacea fornicatus TaxID=995702 RepID=UPI00338D86AA
MIKVYTQKVFWVLVALACFVVLILGSVKICQIVSENCFKRRDSRVLIFSEDGDITIINRMRERSRDEDLLTVKQSYKNLAPPLYSTLSKASAVSSYELPPPYPVDYI